MTLSLDHPLDRLGHGSGRHRSTATMAIAAVGIAATAAAAAAAITAMALGGRTAHAYPTPPVVAAQAQVRDVAVAPPRFIDASLPGASEVLTAGPASADEAAATF